MLRAIISGSADRDRSDPARPVYDKHETRLAARRCRCCSSAVPGECRAISDGALREMLERPSPAPGMTRPRGQPLHFTPHDFRRIFITDAVMSGLPPHIAQVIAATGT